MLSPDVPSPARRRASAMATKLKSYFTRRGSKTDMAREEGAAEEKQPSPVPVSRVTSTSEPSSPQPLAGMPSQGERDREDYRERDDSPLRCWTSDRNKCLQGLELNSRNYYSVPLEVMHRTVTLLNTPDCFLLLCAPVSDSLPPSFLHTHTHQGSLLDHPVSVCTTGRYLIAGLRDGGVNVNNLTVRPVIYSLYA
jgi:hypothetical protein